MILELVDRSAWNRITDAAALKTSGIAGMIAKASEGDLLVDPAWRESQAIMLSWDPETGPVGGSYHFARPDLGNSAQNEAQGYLSCHDRAVFDPARPWIFALDAESADGDAAWCYAWMDYVAHELDGISPWFYSFGSWISSRGVQAFNRPLWLAWPDANGSLPGLGWPVTTMQQYGTRSVPGIEGQVDANRFFGSAAQLRTLAGIAPPPPPPPPPPHSEEIDMLVVTVPDVGEMWLLSGSLYVHLDDPASAQSFLDAGLKQVTIDKVMHQTLIAGSVSSAKLAAAGTLTLSGTLAVS